MVASNVITKNRSHADGTVIGVSGSKISLSSDINMKFKAKLQIQRAICEPGLESGILKLLFVGPSDCQPKSIWRRFFSTFSMVNLAHL